MINLKKCPLCESKRFKKVTKNLKKELSGVKYVVADVTYYLCENCGEGFLLPEESDKIDSARKKNSQPGRKHSA